MITEKNKKQRVGKVRKGNEKKPTAIIELQQSPKSFTR